jgi:hypothetical protein
MNQTKTVSPGKFENIPMPSPKLTKSQGNTKTRQLNTLPSNMSSNIFSHINPKDFEINTKFSDETKNVFQSLKENMEELLTYHTNFKTKPASESLINALREFKAYTKGMKNNQLSYEIEKLSGLPLKKPGNTDDMDSYINPYENFTNTDYNVSLIKFLLSIRNYDTVEEYLYKMKV